MLDGKFPNGCSLCKYHKATNQYMQTKQFETIHFYNPVDVNIETGNETNAPIAVEYKPSNRCNLMCRMCRPSDSDMIEKEANTHSLLDRYNDHKYPTIEMQGVEEYIITNKIKKVSVLGGETALDQKAIAFLEKLDKDVFIQSTTNATVINKRYSSLFKDLNLVISVDGINKTYEYIRTNAKWHITEKNILYILNEERPKSVWFSVVLMPYNIFNIRDMLLWFDWLEQNSSTKFDVYFCDSDDYKTKLNVLLNEDVDSVLDQLYTSNISLTKRLQDVLDILQHHKHSATAHAEFKDYNNKLDKIRHTNLLSLDQRFANYV